MSRRCVDLKNEEIELQKIQEQDAEIVDAEVEGYGYCATDKQRCMQDCNGASFLSTLS